MSELRVLVNDKPDEAAVFLNRYGGPIGRFGIHALVERHVRTATEQLPSLKNKRVSAKAGDRQGGGWAVANSLPEDRWCSGTSRGEEGHRRKPMPFKTHSIGQRAELYNFLDTVPL